MKKLASPAPALKGSVARPRVLYVEDNDDNWRVAELRVSRSYNLVHAATDRIACQMLCQPGKLYAVLMDIELRGSILDGIQLTHLIRGTLPPRTLPDYAQRVPISRVPIVIVTAYGDRHSRSELLAAGASDVVLKPVDFTRLNLTLAQLYIDRALARGSG